MRTEVFRGVVGEQGNNRSGFATFGNFLSNLERTNLAVAALMPTSTSALYHVLIPYIAGANSLIIVIIYLGRLSIFPSS
ncbi:MAG: hypothetical protein ABI947_10885 [Chloroflexota bacterium]